jgi:hypothetical protein
MHIRTIVLTIVYEGLLVGFWFIDHACAGSFFLDSWIFRLRSIYVQPGATVVYAVSWHDSVGHSFNLSKHVLLTVSSYLCLAYYTLSVRPCFRRTAFLASSHHKGDITDEKFFRKAHDSDCTQFSYLYKAVPAHGAFFIFSHSSFFSCLTEEKLCTTH